MISKNEAESNCTCHSGAAAIESLPLSEQLKQIKYLYVEKSEMEKTFIITFIASLSDREQQIKIKASSKYNAKQKFYLLLPKNQILRIEEKQNERN